MQSVQDMELLSSWNFNHLKSLSQFFWKDRFSGFFYPPVLGWSDAADVSLSLGFWTDADLSAGQSVELEEVDASWLSPPLLSVVFVFFDFVKKSSIVLFLFEVILQSSASTEWNNAYDWLKLAQVTQ